MKTNSRKSTRAGILLPAVGALATCLLTFVLAEIPAWWNDRGLVKKDGAGAAVDASDFAAANQGQLKNVAIAAYEEFLAGIPAELGGLGPDIAPVPGHPADQGSPGWRLRNLASQWVRIDRATGRVLRTVLDAQQHPTGTFSVNGTGPRQPAPGANAQKDFAAITQGQLKAVAAPFYARLAEVFWRYNSGTPLTSEIDPAWAKPWTDAPDDDKHHAMANLGQLKRVFSLDLHSDADRDGLTNLAELLANKLRSSSDPTKWTDLSNAYSTGGQLTDGEQVTLGLDPTDPASGAPPTAPAGLHITFPDLVTNPGDPDISQIRVEWTAPTQTGITVTFEKTYAGNPAGWESVPLSPGTQSPVFSGLPSKRVHEYRVTFTGANLLAASRDIAYEVPVIRGYMQRQRDCEVSFIGASLYPVLPIAGTPFVGIPRKFKGMSHTWEFNSKDIYPNPNEPSSTETRHEGGSYTRNADIGTRKYLIAGEAHESFSNRGPLPGPYPGDDYDWTRNRLFSVDQTAPGASAPSGLVALDFADISTTSDDYEYPFSDFEHTHVGFALQPFPLANASGNAIPWRPFISLTARERGQYFLDHMLTPYDHYSWNAEVALVPDAVGQHLDWTGSYDRIFNLNTTHGDHHYPSVVARGHTLVDTAPRDFAHIYVNTGDSIAGRPWLFPIHGTNPPSGVVPTVTLDQAGTSWTREYNTYPAPGSPPPSVITHYKSWTETVALTGEITTNEMLDAALSTLVPVSTLDWTLPGGQPPSQFSNRFRVDEVGLNSFSQFNNTSLWWDYSTSYTGVTTAQLAAASIPGQSYVHIEPEFGGIVGRYTLYSSETWANMLSSEYKFRFYPPAESATITWLETFTPDPSEADQTRQYKVKTYAVPPEAREMPDSARIAVDRTEGWSNPAAPPAKKGTVMVGLLPVELVPDYTHNEAIGEDDKGKVTDREPWRFWINDDDDDDSQPTQSPDHTAPYVNGVKDLKDFFPVFLDIQQLVKAFPPSASGTAPGETVTYTLSQEDDALNFVETDLTAEDAFFYRDDMRLDGYGINLAEPASSATKQRVTEAGVELSGQFLNNLRHQNRGVILCEGRAPTNKPLLCRVKKGGNQIAELKLPLLIGPRILLLLHGMNSNTATWDTFVKRKFGSNKVKECATDIHIEEPDFLNAPLTKLTTRGVRCYRLQFGGKETSALVRNGLDGLTLGNAPDYLAGKKNKCGDFETFAELGTEVDHAIKLLITKYKTEKYTDGNIQIVLLGHSRGGIAARQFLQAGSDASQKVVGAMLTTGTPHHGGQMGRIYQWLKENPRPPGGTPNADWLAVDFLKNTIDVRRPVIGDVADNSNAITDLNRQEKVKNMPSNIRYGEIVYKKAKLGVLKLLNPFHVTLYSAFDGIPAIPPAVDPTRSLSAAAKQFILGADKTPENYPGDGLIFWKNQYFTTGLPGFAGTKVEPRLIDTNTVVHTDEPSRVGDLNFQLNALMPDWFP